MMGDDWPTTRAFPNQTVNDGDDVRLGGLTLSVRALGPGESHADSIWFLDDSTVFAGDIAYNGMHAYLADGCWRDWLLMLDRLAAELPDDITLHVGHGPSGGNPFCPRNAATSLPLSSRSRNADAVDRGDHTGVVEDMRRLLPTDALLFLMELSIAPVRAALRGAA